MIMKALLPNCLYARRILVVLEFSLRSFVSYCGSSQQLLPIMHLLVLGMSVIVSQAAQLETQRVLTGICFVMLQKEFNYKYFQL